MRSSTVLDTPRPVAGHPIEILEVPKRGERGGFIWLLKLRITPPGGKPVECQVRYDRGKRITIDTIPESEAAYGILLAARGDHPSQGPNPLAEAVEAATR